MALTALFIWSLVDGFIYGGSPNYFFAKLVSVITIILIIPIIFYGYKTITKRPIIIIDIASFFVTVFFSQFLGYIILNSDPISYIIKYVSVILLIAIFGTYLLVTIYPIKSFIFKDPLTNKYGLKGHK